MVSLEWRRFGPDIFSAKASHGGEYRIWKGSETGPPMDYFDVRHAPERGMERILSHGCFSLDEAKAVA